MCGILPPIRMSGSIIMNTTRVGLRVMRGKSSGGFLCICALIGSLILAGCSREERKNDPETSPISPHVFIFDMRVNADGSLLWVALNEKEERSTVWEAKDPCPILLQERISKVVDRHGNFFPVRFAVDPNVKMGEFWPLVKAVVEARVINTSFRSNDEAEGPGVGVYVMHDEEEWSNISEHIGVDIQVSIDGQRLMLNGANITRAAYAAVLEEIAREGDPREANFYIFATPDTEYRTLDDVLKTASRSGIRRLALSALPE